MSKTILADRFSKMWEPEPFSGCWLWTRNTSPQGYGKIFNGKGQARAHRIAWQIYKGDIPKGLHILHRCDTPMCVNPNHLFVGTHQDNIRDRDAKGKNCPGVRNGRARLTEQQVLDIRQRYSEGERMIDIASSLNLSKDRIFAIVHRLQWRHLTTGEERRGPTGRLCRVWRKK